MIGHLQTSHGFFVARILAFCNNGDDALHPS
jgi:hypothetical protein